MKYSRLLIVPVILAIGGCSLSGSSGGEAPLALEEPKGSFQQWQVEQHRYQELVLKGDFQGALEPAKAMYDIAKKDFEPYESHQNETLSSYKALSQTYLQLGSFPEAQSLLEESRPIVLKMFGEKSIALAALERNLASVASAAGDYTGAVSHLTRATFNRQRIYGLLDAQLFEDYFVLAQANFSAGNHSEASLRIAQGLAVVAFNGRARERPLGQLVLLQARVANALTQRDTARALVELALPLLNRPDAAPPKAAEYAQQVYGEVYGKPLGDFAAASAAEPAAFDRIEQQMVNAISLATEARIDPRDVQTRELPALLETLGRMLDRYGSELLLKGQQSGAHQIVARAAEFQRMAEKMERGH